jgi:hypothetical protein
MNAPSRALIADVLGGHGLHLRGAWEPQAADALPVLANGKTAAVVWMVGGVGSSQWPAFSASPFYADGLPDPLDRWSRAIAEELAERWGGLALFPFEGPPLDVAPTSHLRTVARLPFRARLARGVAGRCAFFNGLF